MDSTLQQQVNTANQPGQAVDQDSENKSGTSIELFIGDDGTIEVSVEANDDDSQNEAEPIRCQSLQEAIVKIKQIAGQVLNGNAADTGEEDLAYRKEMAAGY